MTMLAKLTLPAGEGDLFAYRCSFRSSIKNNVRVLTDCYPNINFIGYNKKNAPAYAGAFFYMYKLLFLVLSALRSSCDPT